MSTLRMVLSVAVAVFIVINAVTVDYARAYQASYFWVVAIIQILLVADAVRVFKKWKGAKDGSVTKG